MSSTESVCARPLEISISAASFTSGLAEMPQLAEPPLTSNVAITLARPVSSRSSTSSAMLDSSRFRNGIEQARAVAGVEAELLVANDEPIAFAERGAVGDPLCR